MVLPLLQCRFAQVIGRFFTKLNWKVVPPSSREKMEPIFLFLFTKIKLKMVGVLFLPPTPQAVTLGSQPVVIHMTIQKVKSQVVSLSETIVYLDRHLKSLYSFDLHVYLEAKAGKGICFLVKKCKCFFNRIKSILRVI